MVHASVGKSLSQGLPVYSEWKRYRHESWIVLRACRPAEAMCEKVAVVQRMVGVGLGRGRRRKICKSAVAKPDEPSASVLCTSAVRTVSSRPGPHQHHDGEPHDVDLPDHSSGVACPQDVPFSRFVHRVILLHQHDGSCHLREAVHEPSFHALRLGSKAQTA